MVFSLKYRSFHSLKTSPWIDCLVNDRVKIRTFTRQTTLSKEDIIVNHKSVLSSVAFSIIHEVYDLPLEYLVHHYTNVLRTNLYQSSWQVLKRLFLSFKFLFLQLVELVTKGIRLSAFLEVGLRKCGY